MFGRVADRVMAGDFGGYGLVNGASVLPLQIICFIVIIARGLVRRAGRSCVVATDDIASSRQVL